MMQPHEGEYSLGSHGVAGINFTVIGDGRLFKNEKEAATTAILSL